MNLLFNNISIVQRKNLHKKVKPNTPSNIPSTASKSSPKMKKVVPKNTVEKERSKPPLEPYLDKNPLKEKEAPNLERKGSSKP